MAQEAITLSRHPGPSLKGDQADRMPSSCGEVLNVGDEFSPSQILRGET